jgi:hypothetical protein
MAKTYFDHSHAFSVHPHVMDELVDSGDLKPLTAGGYVFQGGFLKLLRFLDGLTVEFAQTLHAVEQEYPARWPMELFEKINYLADFPQNLIVCAGAKKSRLQELSASFPPGTSYAGLPLGEMFEAPEWALGTSTCDPCYYAFRISPLANNRIFFAKNKCFRNESSHRGELDRLTEFSMREIMGVGTAEHVLSVRERFLGFQSRLVRFLGLSARIEVASDPFFTDNADLKRKYQETMDSKLEVLADLGDQRPPLAVSSLNWHGDHFGRCFDARLWDGAHLHSCCLAFGLERLAFAFLSQHGVHAAQWPEQVRQRFEIPAHAGDPLPGLGPLSLAEDAPMEPAHSLESPVAVSPHVAAAILQRSIASVFSVHGGFESFSRETCALWDSLGHVSFMLQLEQALGWQIPPRDYHRLHSDYGTLLEYLSGASGTHSRGPS